MDLRHTYSCVKCGNKVQSELNIEASIHHSRDVVCFDIKACGRRIKRRKK